MKRTNIKNRILTMFTLLSVVIASSMSFSSVVFASDNPLLDKYTEVSNGLISIGNMVDGGYFGDDEWYDTKSEAASHARFSCGSHAELKIIYMPIHGWVTKGCTIQEVKIVSEKGKWAPVYKNSYNGNFYLGSRYQ